MEQPTEKQLAYAKSLHIDISPNETKESLKVKIQDKVDKKPQVPVEKAVDKFTGAREAKNVPMYVSYCKDLFLGFLERADKNADPIVIASLCGDIVSKWKKKLSHR